MRSQLAADENFSQVPLILSLVMPASVKLIEGDLNSMVSGLVS